MFNFLKMIAKFAMVGFLWLILFSIPFQGEPVFGRLHGIISEVEFFQNLDGKLAGIWDRVYKSAVAGSEDESEEEVTF